MKIDPLLLADVLSGKAAAYTPRHKLFTEIRDDPRRAEALWFLQSLQRTPEKFEQAVRDILVSEPEAEWDCGPNHYLKTTLKFLESGQDDSCSPTAGRLPEENMAELFGLMHEHAKAAKATLADTRVSKLIFKELDLALIHKVPVVIIGDSRFGKTKAVSVWCEMRPGRMRVVTVPDSNREWDFLAAHADAFGIEYNHRTTLQRLKRSVQLVIQNSGLFICYDEAHFLTPVNYCADTPPKRINFVRCQVIDKGVGCAFFATPQSLNQTLEKYAAKTKYNLEQWIGRLAPPVILADYYDRDELVAVAKVHFPEFPDKLLALICSRAMQSEAYLKGMEFAARYASALAQDRRHRTPTLQDVDESIERMMPAKVKAPGNQQRTTVLPSANGHLTPGSRPILDLENGQAGDEATTEFPRQLPGRRAGTGNASHSRTRGDLVAA